MRAGRLSTTTFPAGPDPTSGSITSTRTYSPTTGNLTGITSSDGQSLTFTYDGALLTSTTWAGAASRQVTHGYDNNFRVRTENGVDFGYDGDGS